jgi:hypothetical protein
MLEAVIAGALEHNDSDMKSAKEMAAIHQRTTSQEVG